MIAKPAIRNVTTYRPIASHHDQVASGRPDEAVRTDAELVEARSGRGGIGTFTLPPSSPVRR
jgi:hypothetical protein